MFFKFLTNNENALFNQEIINSCQRFWSDYMEKFNNHELSNRQQTIPNLGTIFLVDFEYDNEERAFFGSINFLYESMEHFPKMIIRFRDERIILVTLTH
jgi:hypothetical protein